MKRSEMIEIIERRLLSWDGHCTRSFSGLILEDVENAGMRCPIYWTEEEKEVVEFDPSGSYDGYTVKRNVAHYEWEPENE